MNRIVEPPNLQIMVTLNVSLNTTERLKLANAMFERDIRYNSSYTLTSVQINMDPSNPNKCKKSSLYYMIDRFFFPAVVTLTSAQPSCEECRYLSTGICNDAQTGCTCFQNYTGYLCRESNPTTPLESRTPEANWTVIVAVVSAIAGLLLIISIVMCVFYICTKRRQSSATMKTSISRQQFTIPRAHIPTMGTGTRGLTTWDGFSLDNTYDEQFVDASDSFPSSSNTSYNTTYRTNAGRPEADFGIFDELENRIPIPKGHIPRPQMIDMLGTLNSIPAQDQFDDPSGGTSIFSDSRDLDEIELVTDMVADMTKDDDMDDEFVEAMNPNLAIPRLALEPEMKSSGWFSVSLPLIEHRTRRDNSSF